MVGIPTSVAALLLLLLLLQGVPAGAAVAAQAVVVAQGQPLVEHPVPHLALLPDHLDEAVRLARPSSTSRAEVP